MSAENFLVIWGHLFELKVIHIFLPVITTKRSVVDHYQKNNGPELGPLRDTARQDLG